MILIFPLKYSIAYNSKIICSIAVEYDDTDTVHEVGIAENHDATNI